MDDETMDLDSSDLMDFDELRSTSGPGFNGACDTASHEEADRWATETLAGLSLEKKVAQMICEQMRGEYRAEDDEQFQYWAELVRDHGIGAFVVYGGTPQETAHLLNRLQGMSEIPL